VTGLPNGWAGAVTVITGGSRGIGREVARAAAGRGAKIGVIARHAADLESLRDELGPGGQVAVARADVGDRTQLVAAIGQLEAELGPVDVLVANAGIGGYGPFVDIDPDTIDRLVQVNLLGTLHAVRAVVPGMVDRRRGHIVTVGSIAGRIGSPFEATYAATKFGQVGFTEALAVELSAFGIGVSMVNPGPVATGFFDARGHAYQRAFPRQVTPAKVAAAVMAAVERDRLEQVVPRWLRPAVVVRHLVPGLFLRGTRSTFRKELRALARDR
jgi:short-subunit dehydrogenase